MKKVMLSDEQMDEVNGGVLNYEIEGVVYNVKSCEVITYQQGNDKPRRCLALELDGDGPYTRRIERYYCNYTEKQLQDDKKSIDTLINVRGKYTLT